MTYLEAKREWQRNYWISLQSQTGGNVAEMARLANVARTDVYKHFRRCGIPYQTKNRGNQAWQDLK